MYFIDLSVVGYYFYIIIEKIVCIIYKYFFLYYIFVLNFIVINSEKIDVFLLLNNFEWGCIFDKFWYI